MTLLYQILIAPIEAVMHVVLSSTYSIVGSYGVAIFVLSLLINLALLPLFQIAERWQEAERQVQKVLRPKLQEFRKAFSGEERYTMIHTLYRQTGYHPIYAMRSSVGLLLQLPFWIAAYQLLSHYEPLQGASFLLFEDLGKPDRLLWGINLLPFVMTGANLLAAFSYTKQLSLMEKIQPLLLALVFLVLLYHSPTGLLLYWTFNSLFSLARIAFLDPIQKRKLWPGEAPIPPLPTPATAPGLSAPEQRRTILPPSHEFRATFLRAMKDRTNLHLALFLIVVGLQLSVHGHVLDKDGRASMTATLVSITLLAYLTFVPSWRSFRGSETLRSKLRLILVGLLSAAFAVMNVAWLSAAYEVPHPARTIGGILLTLLFLMFASPMCDRIRILRTMPQDPWLFAAGTCLTMFVLCIANPLTLYISSEDFVGGVYHVTGRLVVYFAAVTLALATLYVLMDTPARNGLTLLSVFSSFSLILYSTIGVKDAGIMDQFILDVPASLERTTYEIVTELALLMALFGATSYATVSHRRNVTHIVAAMLATVFAMSVMDIYGAKDPPAAVSNGLPADNADIMSFSREQNVLILMLDGFPGGYVQRILDEASDVLSAYDGFVWYPNMLTTNAGTWGSIATLAGGHRYTVQEINNRNETSLRSAINEAYYVYSDAFLPKGYQVSYVNPAGSGGCERLDKRVHCTPPLPYGIHYHKLEDPDAPFPNDADSNLPLMLTMVSLFKASPFLLKSWIYDGGGYRGANSQSLQRMTANSYKAREWGFLRVLAREPNADSPSKTFKFIQLSIPHYPHALNGECRLLPDHATVFTESVCALKEIGVLLGWMKKNGIYDASKIVVVSDHGWLVDNPMFSPDFVKTIPEGYQQRASAGFAQSLLLVKDFGAKGSLRRSDTFVSSPDVPSLVCSTDVACRDILPDPTRHNVGERSLVFNITALPMDEEKTNKFDIIESYEVRKNIFDAANWKKIK